MRTRRSLGLIALRVFIPLGIEIVTGVTTLLELAVRAGVLLVQLSCSSSAYPFSSSSSRS